MDAEVAAAQKCDRRNEDGATLKTTADGTLGAAFHWCHGHNWDLGGNLPPGAFVLVEECLKFVVVEGAIAIDIETAEESTRLLTGEAQLARHCYKCYKRNSTVLEMPMCEMPV